MPAKEEAGVITTEFLIAGTFFLIALFGLFELAIWAHTRTIAKAAALEAATAANGAGAQAGGTGPSTGAAQDAARSYLGDLATVDEVTVTRDPQWVTATITISKVNWLVPGLRITEQAQQTTERYVPPNG